MRATAVWINRVLWTIIVTVVVGLGAIVALGRTYIGYVEAYQDRVVAEIERRTGLHLAVARLSAHWVHLSPEFTVDGLQVFNPQRPDQAVIRVDHLQVRLGLLQSLSHLTPVFSLVDGRGASAWFDETAPGRWQLRGFPGGRGSLDPLIDALLRIHRADIRASRAHLQFTGGRTATLDAQSVQLHRLGRFRRLRLALRVAEDGAPLKVLLEARGDPRRARSFTARGYAEFAKVNLTPVLPFARSFGFDLTHGRIDGAAWLDWRQGDISVRGHIAVPELDLAGITGHAMQPVKNIEAPFLLRDRDGTQQLWLPEVRAHWGSEKLDLKQLLVERTVGAPVFTVSLPRLHLAVVQRALHQGRVLPAHWAEIVDTMAPSGELRNVHLQLPMAPDTLDRTHLRAGIHGLKLLPWEGAPGVSGIDGFIDTGLSSGTVVLDATDASLDFPHVYHQPVPFKQLQGTLAWQRLGERIQVRSGPITAVSDAGRAGVRLGLDLNLHAHDPDPPLMTLMVGMRHSSARFRKRFVPYTLQPNLLAWLDRAVGAADLPRGGFIYHGSLRADDHSHRSVQLFLDVTHGELAYQPGWPALHDLDAELWVDDTDVDVDGGSAAMLDKVQLRDIAVALRPRDGGDWLTVSANAEAADDDLLRLLRESPLQQRLHGALDGWHWQGPARAAVKLGIPIGGRNVATDIDIDARLGPGTLQLGDLDLKLDQVSGPLRYRSRAGRDHGLSSPGIDAKLYGKPLKLGIATTAADITTVRARGRIAMRDLGNWLSQPLRDYASGTTAFDLNVQLGGERNRLWATSDLSGVAIDLPAPYGKAAAAHLPLTLAMPLQGQRRLELDAAGWADLNLLWSEPASTADKRHLLGGVLRLGGTGSRRIEPGKLIVTGQVRQIDLDRWHDLFARNRDKLAAGAAAVGNAGGNAPLALSLQELTLPQVAIAGQTLRDVHLSGAHTGSNSRIAGWQLQTRSDRFDGSVLIPDAADQPLQFDLTALRLPAPTAAAHGTGKSGAGKSALAAFDPAQAIAADVHIAHLWFGKEDWGDISFQLRPVAHGLRLNRLSGTLRGIRLEPGAKQPAELTWLRYGDLHTTRFSGRLAVANLGDVLARWHFEKSVTSRKGSFDTDVSWYGAPDQLTLQKLDGSVAIDLQNGQFLKASGSATGALKLVGIFNFTNLLRRLQLDFSDLFKDGVSFDSIDGRVGMHHGVFETRDPIDITSPSSHFRLSGKVDFNTDNTDLELVATLPVASNLPWVAALAGGLPAAAGVYVASKLFQEQVNHFSSAVYQISGPWQDPTVKFRRIFDDQLPARSKSADNGAGEKTDKSAPASAAPPAQNNPRGTTEDKAR